MSRTKWGIVMSIDGRRMTLLRSDGSWQTAAWRSGVQVGDRIAVSAGGSGRAWAALVAAALVVVLLAASTVMLPARRAMAYVSVEGIPGVELVANGHGRVLRGEATSVAGEALLNSVTVAGKSLRDAVQQLMQHLNQQGQLPEPDVMLVTVTPIEDEISGKVLQRLQQQAAAGALAGASDAVADVPAVEQLVIPAAVQAEAKALGLPPGQYALALKASEAGVEIDLDELEDRNVVQALQAQGLNPGQVIKQLQQEADWQQLLEKNKDKVKKNGKPKPQTDADSTIERGDGEEMTPELEDRQSSNGSDEQPAGQEGGDDNGNAARGQSPGGAGENSSDDSNQGNSGGNGNGKGR